MGSRARGASTTRRSMLLIVIALGACARRPTSSSVAPPPLASSTPPVTAPSTPPVAAPSTPSEAPVIALGAASTPIAGGALRMRLPDGAVEIRDPDLGPGMLVPTRHTVAVEGGRLVIDATDTGLVAGPDFGTRVVGEERAIRCVPPDTEIAAAPATALPTGFTAVAFRPDPDTGCGDAGAPDVRVWIASPDGTVVRLELVCGASTPCDALDREGLEAMLASLAPGTPIAAPAGTRKLGLVVEVPVPEGYLVRRWYGADYTMYFIAPRGPFGEPHDALEISLYTVPSDRTLAADFARRGDRTRLVPGRFAGRRTRFLEITREGRTLYFGRIDLPELQAATSFGARDPAALARMRAMVADATLTTSDE